ncbi:hypothetical protein Ocin01_06623 [Orchesella cincta]|uniref:Uncharacterized protein n=1 Tax=Orchesella cincta TaxID=48709 RepID=A0A1D2N533_ORCCI|nr:hypothetical protein Ocin01_06623 [Orchesella cincta]
MATVRKMTTFSVLLSLIGWTSAFVFQLNTNSKPQKEMTAPAESELFEKFYNEYFSRQESFFTEAKELAKAGESTDASCKTCNFVGGDINTCFADCITKKVGSYQNLAENIADTVKTMFCKPLGLKMDKFFGGQEGKGNPIWRDFKTFAQRVKKQLKSSVPLQNVVESWISNVHLLDESPMHVYSKVRTQISDLFDESEMDMANPNSFTAKCNSKDLSAGLSTLIGAGKQKGYVMDILFRGLFSVRSSLFYTFGNPTNQFGSFLEGLNAMVGKNCDLISYAMDEGSSESNCDSLGHYPNFDFPFPRDLIHLAPKCPEEGIY